MPKEQNPRKALKELKSIYPKGKDSEDEAEDEKNESAEKIFKYRYHNGDYASITPIDFGKFWENAHLIDPNEDSVDIAIKLLACGLEFLNEIRVFPGPKTNVSLSQLLYRSEPIRNGTNDQVYLDVNYNPIQFNRFVNNNLHTVMSRVEGQNTKIANFISRTGITGVTRVAFKDGMLLTQAEVRINSDLYKEVIKYRPKSINKTLIVPQLITQGRYVFGQELADRNVIDLSTQSDYKYGTLTPVTNKVDSKEITELIFAGQNYTIYCKSFLFSISNELRGDTSVLIGKKDKKITELKKHITCLYCHCRSDIKMECEHFWNWLFQHLAINANIPFALSNNFFWVCSRCNGRVTNGEKCMPLNIDAVFQQGGNPLPSFKIFMAVVNGIYALLYDPDKIKSVYGASTETLTRDIMVGIASLQQLEPNRDWLNVKAPRQPITENHAVDDPFGHQQGGAAQEPAPRRQRVANHTVDEDYPFSEQLGGAAQEPAPTICHGINAVVVNLATLIKRQITLEKSLKGYDAMATRLTRLQFVEIPNKLNVMITILTIQYPYLETRLVLINTYANMFITLGMIAYIFFKLKTIQTGTSLDMALGIVNNLMGNLRFHDEDKFNVILQQAIEKHGEVYREFANIQRILILFDPAHAAQLIPLFAGAFLSVPRGMSVPTQAARLEAVARQQVPFGLGLPAPPQPQPQPPHQPPPQPPPQPQPQPPPQPQPQPHPHPRPHPTPNQGQCLPVAST